MNLIEHAQNEFRILGWPGDCDMQEAIDNDILELLKTFSDQGHSGFSASYLLGVFEKLARFQPISPLTGEPDEWREVEGGTLMNIRDSEVVKFAGDDQVYWLHGIIFRNPDGSTYTSDKSHVPISFPWTHPKPEIRDVEPDDPDN